VCVRERESERESERERERERERKKEREKAGRVSIYRSRRLCPRSTEM
jgi:hypothetical protein